MDAKRSKTASLPLVEFTVDKEYSKDSSTKREYLVLTAVSRPPGELIPDHKFRAENLHFPGSQVTAELNQREENR